MPLNETPPAGGVSNESTEPYELPSGRLGLIFFAVERKGLREYKMWFEDGWETKKFFAPKPGIYCHTDFDSPLRDRIGAEPRLVLSVEGVPTERLILQGSVTPVERVLRLLDESRSRGTEHRRLVLVARTPDEQVVEAQPQPQSQPEAQPEPDV